MKIFWHLENKYLKMNFSRRRTRKFLFQKLYTRTFWDFDEKIYRKHFFDNIFTKNLDILYLDEIYSLIIKKENYLINIIKKYAPKFDVNSMNYAIIIPTFIGLSEMLFLEEEIPFKVSINEAVELSKIFWDNSSKRIVNWILNSFFEDIKDIKKIEKTFIKTNFNFFKG